MRFAFGVAHYQTYEVKDDPEYVQWEVVYKTKNGTEDQVRQLGARKCDKGDFKDFYPSFSGDKKEIEILQKQNVLMCIDDWSEMIINGDENQDIQQTLEINLIPC